MIFGFAAFSFGYALFYWGLHHFPQYAASSRYSLYRLLGFGNLFGAATAMNPGTPVKFKVNP